MSGLREWLGNWWWKWEWYHKGWDVMAGFTLDAWSLGFRIYCEHGTTGISVDLGPAYFCLAYWR